MRSGAYLIEEFVSAILHGDTEHRSWLRAAGNAFAAGQPIPKPSGKGSDPIIEAVRDDLHRRSQLGLAKYGVGLDRSDLSLRDWLQHAYEETLDQANYLKRAIMEIDGDLR